MTDRGAKSWHMMYRIHGEKARYTLGTYPAFKLKDARKLAGEKFTLVSEGVDPRRVDEVNKAAAERDRKLTF